jgi:DNA-binding NarL/FixJ family response regulator
VVGVALTAEEAVRLAEEERPDVMTMDIRLRGERDGISAALEIFERFGIRSVFVSAYGDAATVARARTASPLGWITKPLRRDQFEEPLRTIWPGGKV